VDFAKPELETGLCALLQSVLSALETLNQQEFSQCSACQFRAKAG
jgi:hypothetical protein